MRIYITGHRNPDMDSVTSAYAYSVLKNRMDSANEYVPVMLGPANSGTKRFFASLGIELPQFLKDVRPRVSEVQKKPIYSVSSSDPLYLLMDIFQSRRPTVVPVIDDGEYRGLLSADDINGFFLRENSGAVRQKYFLSEENISRVIDGEWLRHGESGCVRAPYMVGAMEYQVYLSRLRRLPDKPVLVIGYRKKHIAAAIENQIPGIVITGVTNPARMDVDFSSYRGFVYISYLDTAETLRLLRLSTPVSDIMQGNEGRMCLDSDILFDDAKKTLQESGYRGLSVFADGVWSGFVTRRCFLDKPMQRVILVDHNEAEQSVPGIEEASIVEIIDHHRLAPPRMKTPIYIVSEPLGSTCTIVYGQFRKWGVEIDPLTAKVLLGGLTADTVMLKSPTTTDYDRHVAEKLCAIAGVEDYDAFCRSLFSGSSSLAEEDPETVIGSDMKIYRESGVHFAIGQAEVMSLEEARSLRERYLAALEAVREKNALDWCMLLITDVIHGNSVLLMTPFRKASALAYDRIAEGTYSLPGVLSRKKQLLPEILRVLEM